MSGTNGNRLDCLVGQLKDLQETVLAEMNRVYPEGSRVRFWRSSSQVKPSYGVVIYNAISRGPEVRVRYDNSRHVVGLYPGYTRFHVVPNADLNLFRESYSTS